MKRTRQPDYYLTDPDPQTTAKALRSAINHIEPARKRIALAIDQCSRLDGYDELWTMLGALVEIQDTASEMGERHLVQLLATPIMAAYLRASGHDPESAKKELLRIHGIVRPNAPGSGSVQ